jgi:hypothetical protein
MIKLAAGGQGSENTQRAVEDLIRAVAQTIENPQDYRIGHIECLVSHFRRNLPFPLAAARACLKGV